MGSWEGVPSSSTQRSWKGRHLGDAAQLEKGLPTVNQILPVLEAFRVWRQEAQRSRSSSVEFEASLGYIITNQRKAPMSKLSAVRPQNLTSSF